MQCWVIISDIQKHISYFQQTFWYEDLKWKSEDFCYRIFNIKISSRRLSKDTNIYTRKIYCSDIFDIAYACILVVRKKNLLVPYSNIWAAAWQNQQNDMCAQRRLRSAWASVKSDQSSLCTQWVAKNPRFLHADSEDYQTVDAQTDWSLHWAQSLFCWFCRAAAHFQEIVTSHFSPGKQKLRQCCAIDKMKNIPYHEKSHIMRKALLWKKPYMQTTMTQIGLDIYSLISI